MSLHEEVTASIPATGWLPANFFLFSNLKTAKALGHNVPPTSARARRRGD